MRLRVRRHKTQYAKHSLVNYAYESKRINTYKMSTPFIQHVFDRHISDQTSEKWNILLWQLITKKWRFPLTSHPTSPLHDKSQTPYKGVRHFLKIIYSRIFTLKKEGESSESHVVYVYLELMCKFKIKVCIKVYYCLFYFVFFFMLTACNLSIKK